MTRTSRLLMVAALAAGGTLAIADEPKMHGRAALTFLSPNDSVEVDGTEVDAAVDSALGIGLGWEYRFTDLIGLDLNWAYAKHDVKIAGRKFDSTKFMPITVGANFHFTQGKKVDVFAGPVVGYAIYNDLKRDGNTVQLDNDFVYGANVGVEVPIKDKFAFFGSLKYLRAGAKGDVKVPEDVPVRADVTIGKADVDIDPLVLQAGVAFRY